VMTTAYDRVCQSISKQLNGNDDVKTALALIILRHVDRGECNAERLAEIAFREWTGTDRSAIEDCWAATVDVRSPACLTRLAAGRNTERAVAGVRELHQRE